MKCSCSRWTESNDNMEFSETRIKGLSVIATNESRSHWYGQIEYDSYFLGIVEVSRIL